MSTPEVVELLKQISSQTLTTADASTRGRDKIKYDGDLYRHLQIISDAVTAGYPANPDPDAGVEARPPGHIYTLLQSIDAKLSATPAPTPVKVDTTAVAEAARQGAASAINGATITAN